MPTVAPMPRPPGSAAAHLALLAFVAACAGGGAAADRAPWRSTCRALDADFRIVRGELAQRSSGDLEAVARAARSAAERVRTGYGPDEQTNVPGFAALARDCESWLLGIALEADQGHGEIALDLLGKAERCTSCHQRSGVRPW